VRACVCVIVNVQFCQPEREGCHINQPNNDETILAITQNYLRYGCTCTR